SFRSAVDVVDRFAGSKPRRLEVPVDIDGGAVAGMQDRVRCLELSAWHAFVALLLAPGEACKLFARHATVGSVGLAIEPDLSAKGQAVDDIDAWAVLGERAGAARHKDERDAKSSRHHAHNPPRISRS